MAGVGRIPVGFLDLLGAETSGKTPPNYADSLLPGVELFDLYAAQTFSPFRTGGSTTAPGATITVDIPAGELWLIRSWAIVDSLNIATAFSQWAFRLNRFPRAPSSQPFGNEIPPVDASPLMEAAPLSPATQFPTYAKWFERPLPAGPGMQLRFECVQRDPDVAPRTARIELTVYRFT